MAMAQNVQIPARKPAVAPQAISVFGMHFATQSAQEGEGSARNMPRLAAINREKINVHPNILPLFPPFTSLSLRLLLFIQALPNRPGEYQIPPTTNEETPATNMASQFNVPISIKNSFSDERSLFI